MKKFSNTRSGGTKRAELKATVFELVKRDSKRIDVAKSSSSIYSLSCLDNERFVGTIFLLCYGVAKRVA